MRRLLLLRHAKAVAHAPDDDFGRGLTGRGRDDARRIGEWIAAEKLVPDLCLVSAAQRTCETCDVVASALPGRVETAKTAALYEATRFLVLELLRDLPERARSVLVIGHNPSMGEVANLLTGQGAPALRLRMAAKFPTSALAVLAFDIADWSRLDPHSGRLEHFVTPAES
jgi:phosphohistidine phosphatase